MLWKKHKSTRVDNLAEKSDIRYAGLSSYKVIIEQNNKFKFCVYFVVRNPQGDSCTERCFVGALSWCSFTFNTECERFEICVPWSHDSSWVITRISRLLNESTPLEPVVPDPRNYSRQYTEKKKMLIVLSKHKVSQSIQQIWMTTFNDWKST